MGRVVWLRKIKHRFHQTDDACLVQRAGTWHFSEKEGGLFFLLKKVTC